jgi:hypothetical protein
VRGKGESATGVANVRRDGPAIAAIRIFVAAGVGDRVLALDQP